MIFILPLIPESSPEVLNRNESTVYGFLMNGSSIEVRSRYVLYSSRPVSQKASTATASSSLPDLAQFVQLEANAGLDVRQASQQIEDMKKKLLTARGAERRRLQAALDATQSRVEVLQAASATLRQLIEFTRSFGGRETGDLVSKRP